MSPRCVPEGIGVEVRVTFAGFVGGVAALLTTLLQTATNVTGGPK